LRDASFDLVVSEYGASVWCDPQRWVREAARLLRPDGRLVFLTNSVLATLCVPEEEGEAQDRLLRPQRDLNRVQWPGGGSEFHTGHGDWMRILRASGFVVGASRAACAGRGNESLSTTTSRRPVGPPAVAGSDDLWVARVVFALSTLVWPQPIARQ
jgi:SAM-dependent methyltransferase